ncbi:uncharacterized protein LOC115215028 [Argonauta hians]
MDATPESPPMIISPNQSPPKVISPSQSHPKAVSPSPSPSQSGLKSFQGRSTPSLPKTPLFKKKKIIPKSPIATARRLNLNPEAALTDRPVVKPEIVTKVKQSTSKLSAGPPPLPPKFIGHTIRKIPSYDAVKWLRHLLKLPPKSAKKKSYYLMKGCQPCCIVLTKLPLEPSQKSVNLIDSSTPIGKSLQECSSVCRHNYAQLHRPWMCLQHKRMKRVFAALLFNKNLRSMSVKLEHYAKSPKLPKAHSKQGPPLLSATPDKMRFFFLELKRKIILIPVIGNKMGHRAYELDNPQNIGILYNIAASLQKSSEETD